MTSEILKYNAKKSAVFGFDADRVMESIKLQKGMDIWLDDKSRGPKLECLCREWGYPYHTPYRALFWNGKSRMAIYFRTDGSNSKRITPMNSEANAPLMHALNQLINDGWRVNVELGFVDPRYIPNSGLVLKPVVNSAGSAFKDKVKIDLGWEREHVKPDRFTLCLTVMCKVGNSKHYRVCNNHSFHNIGEALKLANEEVHRIKHGLVKMPEPRVFSESPYKSYTTRLTDIGGGLDAHSITVKNMLRRVSICGIITLQPDGTFSIDAHNPNNNNVWVLVSAHTYYGYQYLLAVNGDKYHFLSGKKYLRLDLKHKPANMTKGDMELISRAVSEWIDLS